MRVPRIRRCALVFLATGFPHAVFSQGPGPLQRANALINSGRSAEAVPILDSFTTARPDAPQGWAMLGAALLVARQLDRAIAPLERATTFPQTRGPSLFNLGLTFALLGRMDDAFVKLHEARKSGQVDMTRLGFDTDAGPVRAHPRYTELLPTAAEYAAPFAESVKILREWRGDGPGDQFGWVARDIGDVDGDGMHDVVTSAPTAASGAGVVYVLSTKRATRLWRVNGAQGDQLGTGVEAAGDVNKDGVPDVIASAPGGDYTLILSGRDGTVLHKLQARQRGEMFGQRVSDAGDIDGDGHADVVIAAPMNDAAGQDAGRVYVISGRTAADLLVLSGESAGHQFGNAVAARTQRGSLLLAVGAPGVAGGGRTYVYRDLSAKVAFTIDPDSTGAALGGMFASIVGDVDGDKVLDVYVSDWSNRAKGPTTGRVYVHSGATGARLHTLTGEAAGNGFGIGVADAGDVNRDGHDDLVIGAWQYSSAAASGGKVYVHSGKDGRLLGALTGRVMGETLGFDATGIGDIDGDSVPDLLLTSAWSAVSGSRSGRVFVVSGGDVLRTMRTVDAPATQTAVAATVSRAEFARFGWIAGRWRGVGHGALAGVGAFFEEYRVTSDSTMQMRTYSDSTFAKATDSAHFELRGGVLSVREGGGNPRVVTRMAGDSVHWSGGGTVYVRVTDDLWRAVFRPRTPGAAAPYYELRRIAQRAPLVSDARLAALADSLLRVPAPPSGVLTMIAAGSPQADGAVFVMMIRVDAGSWIAPHTHNVEKSLRVVRGALLLGHGTQRDTTRVTAYTEGATLRMPANHAHYEGARRTVILALEATGPFRTNFVTTPPAPGSNAR